jgi:predicted Rossmann fold flavoprotein
MIIEKNNGLGKKLLASGAGMCNYTHNEDIETFMSHYGPHGKQLKHAFKAFDAYALMDYLKEMGVLPLIREDGKVFPKSLKSSSLIEAFGSALKSNGVKIHYGEKVTGVSHKNNQWEVATTKGTYDANYVVIATGGASYPSLGTSGDAYEWLKKLDIEIKEVKPALTGILVKAPLVTLAGLSFKAVTLHVRRQGRSILTYCHDLLITHKGFSGPLILNSSRSYEQGDVLSLNFLNMSNNEFDQWLISEVTMNGKRQIKTVLEGLELPKAFLYEVLEKNKIDGTQKVSELSKKQRQILVESFTDYKIEEFESIGFERAMVTAGGVSLKELSMKTFKIKKYEKLFVVGEVVDIDGDTGGYNIQAAFSMGYCAAKQVIKEENG